MKPLASALSEEDMRNIAWFVGSKKVKPGFSKDKDTIALGEKIYRGGIGDRQIPACAAWSKSAVMARLAGKGQSGR